jgi:exonuclease SbcC
MRPLKLTMTAFGPYKDRETIDFTALEDRRLFVISGNTGAGKTTIFDAICFALYGAASGEDRFDSRMLRSHFADEDLHTCVELEFAVGSRRYRVLRQLGHKKGTNKTETGAKIELYEVVDGQEVPSVNRNTVSDVNEKLERIIGLSNDQFSQIVMLPQGEFRKLLTSETENKEEILRRIFRTELYQHVEGQFQQKSKDLKAALLQKQTELDVYIKQLTTVLPVREDSQLSITMAQEHRNVLQILDGLGQEKAHYEELLAQSQQLRGSLQSSLSEKQAQFQEAKVLNEQFKQLESKRLEQTELEAMLPDYTDKERKLRMAEQAARLEPYEEQLKQSSAQETRKRQELEQKRLELQRAHAAWVSADASYQLEQGREEERKLADRELQRLLELAPSVQALHASRQEVAGLLAQEKRDAEQLALIDQEHVRLREKKASQSEQLQLLERETADLPERQDRLRKLREQAKLMKDTLEQERLIGGFAEQENERMRALRQMQTEHDLLEKQWVEGQASLLAEHLHDGQPCPVCGSAEHPLKAEAIGTLPTKEQLQEVKQLLRHVETEFHEVKSQLAATRTILKDKQEELVDYGYSVQGLKEQYDKLIQEGKELKEATERLEEKLKLLQQLKKSSYELEEQLDKLTQKKDQLNQKHKDVLVKLHAKQSMLERELERIPEELRTPEQLKRHLDQQRARNEQLEQAWKLAQEQSQQTLAKLTEEKAHCVQIERQHIEAVEGFKQAEGRFHQELGAAGFDSIEVYSDRKLSEAMRQSYQADLEAFAQKRALVTQQISELERELSGKVRSDLERLQAELGLIEDELDKATTANQAYRSLVQDVGRLQASITTISDRVRAYEEEWQQVKDVYDVLRGDNPLKLSFERYVLIEFLEQILHAANARLHVLSGGQFVLQRSERLEKHNRQSGLGLDVYDAYTGLNRDVKSMSGGEKFNASLCLALGMTDVIQAHQGGITIEMMFIDEGFGSLDEDALNRAIETLIDLQQAGRMIGVISHVQELKAAFPAVLEVRKTREGYSTTALVVK